ncbi:MAG: hypothetical protein R3C03_21235 [Pirellulaceae bacterium]
MTRSLTKFAVICSGIIVSTLTASLISAASLSSNAIPSQQQTEGTPQSDFDQWRQHRDLLVNQISDVLQAAYHEASEDEISKWDFYLEQVILAHIPDNSFSLEDESSPINRFTKRLRRESVKPGLFKSVVLSLAQFGKIQQAMNILERIEDPIERAETLVEISAYASAYESRVDREISELDGPLLSAHWNSL